MRWYVGFDVAFALLYGLGVGRLLRRLPSAGPGHRWRRAALALWAAGVAADLVESLLLARVGPSDGSLLPPVSWVKWAGLVLGLLCALLAARQRRRAAAAGSARRDLWSALRTHRYSVFVVLPFAVLGLASGPDVLDQLPDVQRQWLDDGPWAHLVTAGVLTVVVAAVVFLLGRMRSDLVARRVGRPGVPYELPALVPWLTGPVLAVLGLVGVLVWSDASVLWLRLAVFVAIPLVVWGGSGLARCRGRVAKGPRRPPVTPGLARLTSVVGDVLAVLVLVVPGLGLVRAFAAPVVLDLDGPSLGMLVLGLVGVLWPWLVARVLAWGVPAARTWWGTGRARPSSGASPPSSRPVTGRRRPPRR